MSQGWKNQIRDSPPTSRSPPNKTNNSIGAVDLSIHLWKSEAEDALADLIKNHEPAGTFERSVPNTYGKWILQKTTAPHIIATIPF